MESVSENVQVRKPYDSPAVVYEAPLEVRAGSQTASNPGPVFDLFGLPGDK